MAISNNINKCLQGNGQIPLTNMTNHNHAPGDLNSNLQTVQQNKQVNMFNCFSSCDYYAIAIDVVNTEILTALSKKQTFYFHD